MRKIKEVRLQNFQSHIDSVIQFDDYNIIHGSTNAGKSSIIRAIRWALYNVTPAEGAEIRRFGTKETVVSVTFDDNRKIVRRRTSKDNEYLLIDENGNEQRFTQFGRGPLREVQEFHGMYQVNLFGEPQSINIVDQDEPPFFLSQGPTARGHLISRLAGTLLYESALVLMRRDSSALMRHVEEQRTDLAKKEASIEGLSYVGDLKEFLDDANEQLSNADRIKQNASGISSQAGQIRILRQQYLDNQDAASIADDIIASNDIVESAKLAMSESSVSSSQLVSCRESLGQWREADKVPFSLEELEAILQRAQTVETIVNSINVDRDVCGRVAELRQTIGRLHDMQNICDSYQEDVEAQIVITDNYQMLIRDLSQTVQQIKQEHASVKKQVDTIADAESIIAGLSQEYTDTLLEIGICPTCHQPIHQQEAVQAASSL